MKGKLEKVSYEDFVFACRKITDRAKNFNIDSVFGIPRGGLVPAVYIAHMLNVPLNGFKINGKNPLVVDDIADTGQTLKPYKTFDYKIATIYYHKQSVVEPDIWIYEKKDDWILFPWETEKSTK